MEALSSWLTMGQTRLPVQSSSNFVTLPGLVLLNHLEGLVEAARVQAEI